MRVGVFIALLLAFAFAGYVAITGFLLASSVSGLMTVGKASAILLQEEIQDDPMALGYRGNPMQALSLPFEIVSLDMPLGPTDAWLVPSEGPEVGRAIYVHGIAGAREDGYRHLSMLHKAGYSVLLISYRNDLGAPLTPDGRYGFGLTEWPDLEAAVSYFSPGPDGPGLVIVAESMGAAILGQFLARSDLANRVSAVALDSPALSFSAVLRNFAQQSDYPLAKAMTWSASQFLPHMIDLPLAEAEVASTFASFAGPVFLAHGKGDRIVPIGPSEDLAATRDTVVTLWTGADHLGSYAENPAAYQTSFLDFLSQIGA